MACSEVCELFLLEDYFFAGCKVTNIKEHAHVSLNYWLNVSGLIEIV